VIYLPAVRGRADASGLARKAAAALVAAAAALAGCGYQFVDYRGALGDVRRVAIETLGNDSFDPGYEGVVSEALVHEFVRRGALQVVDDPELADLVIEGRVLPITTVGRSFSSILFALEYQVTVSLDLKAHRRDGRDIKIDAAALTQTEIYLASADIEVSRKNRAEALQRVSRVLAERVHDALYERLLP